MPPIPPTALEPPKTTLQLTNRSRLVGGMIISRACGRLAAATSRFRSDGQPIESSSLSGGWFVASPSLGKSQQSLQRIRRVVGGPAGEADGIERSENEVAQQARIGLAGQNAFALCIGDKLGPPGHIGPPQLTSGGTRRITGKGGGEYGDRVVAQLVHRGGMRVDGCTEPRCSIGMIWNRGQGPVEIGEGRQQPLFEHRLDQAVF